MNSSRTIRSILLSRLRHIFVLLIRAFSSAFYCFLQKIRINWAESIEKKEFILILKSHRREGGNEDSCHKSVQLVLE